MALEISRREVLNNLIRFKDSLLEKKPRAESEEREYKVLLNRKTGDMRFPQKIKNLEYQIARKKGGRESAGDWKEVRIIVTRDAHFEVRDPKNTKLEPTDLDPLAWRVTRETLEVLNIRAKEAAEGGLLPEQAALKDLSKIHLSMPVEEIEGLPAWMGSLTREAAEKRLEGKELGTYLLREGDPLTKAMAFHLSQENGFPVRLFLVTVIEADEKISDILLVRTPQGWTFYQDEPNLNNMLIYKYHPTSQGIIKELKVAKQPISRTST